MNRPTQQVFVRQGSTTYAFDAVIKYEGTSTLKIAEEESDVKGKTHVNYAILKPKTVQMEVSVSDTVTVSGEPLTKGSGSRAVLAHKALISIQEGRDLLTVITPTYTYSKMLIETIAQTADDDHNEGEFYATVTFKEMTVVASAKKTSTSKKKTTTTTTTTTTTDTSFLSTLVGSVTSVLSSLKK